MEALLILIILASLCFIAGWLFLICLTIHPAKLFSRVLLFGVLVSAIIFMILYFGSPLSHLLSVVSGIALFIVGYLISSYIFLTPPVRYDTREIISSKIVRDGHTAIVYFTHGEPETFSPDGWLNQFKEFDSQGIRFIPFIARPLFIFILRRKYLQVGKSNHRQGHIVMLKKLEEAYRLEGNLKMRFYLSFLDDNPRPDVATIKALYNGASRIVVANVFLTISNHTAEGRKLIEQLDLKKYNIDLRFTEPLWNSRLLMLAFIEKIYKEIGDTKKEKVAVALIGHGQPYEWDKEWPTLTEQENSFRDNIIEMLVEEGFDRMNLGNAWMEFKDPKPYTLMKKFVENGVEKILYFAASISADSIHSQSDIPELVHRYHFPEDIEVINLGAWNDHPMVISAIKERIDKELIAFGPQA
jgi:hypothetical protein